VGQGISTEVGKIRIICWLYKRYIDDMNLAVENMRNKKLVDGEVAEKTEEEKEKEKNEEDDKLTIELMRCVADEVNTMIRTEEDYPTKHESKLLPILDLQVGVNEIGYTEDSKSDVYRRRKREKESDEEKEVRRRRKVELTGVGQVNF
jgi:hypothetical protein